MTINVRRLPTKPGARTYSPDLQPLLQMLLSTLADIDFAYESDLEVVRNSSTDEVLKRTVIEKLEQQHREKREPYLHQLAVLEARISAALA